MKQLLIDKSFLVKLFILVCVFYVNFYIPPLFYAKSHTSILYQHLYPSLPLLAHIFLHSIINFPNPLFLYQYSPSYLRHHSHPFLSNQLSPPLSFSAILPRAFSSASPSHPLPSFINMLLYTFSSAVLIFSHPL